MCFAPKVSKQETRPESSRTSNTRGILHFRVEVLPLEPRFVVQVGSTSIDLADRDGCGILVGWLRPVELAWKNCCHVEDESVIRFFTIMMYITTKCRPHHPSHYRPGHPHYHLHHQGLLQICTKTLSTPKLNGLFKNTEALVSENSVLKLQKTLCRT